MTSLAPLVWAFSLSNYVLINWLFFAQKCLFQGIVMVRFLYYWFWACMTEFVPKLRYLPQDASVSEVAVLILFRVSIKWHFSGVVPWGGMYPSPLKVSKKEQMKKYEVFSCNKVIISIFSVWASMTIFSTKKGKLLGGGLCPERVLPKIWGMDMCSTEKPFLHPPDKLQDPYFLIFQFSKALIQPQITNFYKFQAPKP